MEFKDPTETDDSELIESVKYFLDDSYTSSGIYMKRNEHTVFFYSEDHHGIYNVNREGLVHFHICGNKFTSTPNQKR